ncbi:restriction endonuclease subunit S [Paenibacillus lautus]|uniref:restriction endonuclease subunit S n=1 Tax=Paenibacillus lautus TaxID=1401 RepID=UPI003D278D89
MKSKLKRYAMGEFSAVKHGFPFLGEFFASSGRYIVLTPGNFFEKGGFKRTPGKEKYYTSDFPSEYLCTPGDLMIAMTEQAEGLLGSTAIIPEGGIYLHNQRIGLITWDDTIVDKLYLYYLFMTRSVRKQIRDTASGTKVKHTSPERIYDVIVFIPDRDVQKRAASLLWSIDSKIELNNRIIAELEEMAKTIYDYWFVQFDFPDKNGKPYRSSGGEMVWNEKLKRKIPKGWESCPIGELLAKVSVTTKIQSVGYQMCGSIPVIDQSANFIAGYTDIPESVLHFTKGAVIFGDHTRIVKYVGFDFARGADGTQVLISNNACMPELLLYYSILKIDLSNYGYARHFKFLKETEIVVPNEGTAVSFEKVVTSLHEMITKKIFENIELVGIRDWLLPMLMNGQVTVE